MKMNFKIFHFVLVGLVSVSVFGQDISTITCPPKPTDTNFITPVTLLDQCVVYSNHKFEDNYQDPDAVMKIDWNTNIAATLCAKKCEKDNKTASNKDEELQKCVNTINQDNKLGKKCAAAGYLFSTYGRDPKDTSQTNAVSGNQNNQSAGVVTASQNGISATQTTSFNCKSAGVETLDYEPCKSFAEYSANLEVASQLVKAGQNVYYKSKAIDNAYEAQKNSSTDATAGLTAQKNSFKDTQEYYTTSSAMEATKLGVLLTQYQKMPTTDDIKETCSNLKAKGEGLDKACIGLLEINPRDKSNGRINLIMNDTAKTKMKERLAQLGVSTITEGANAYMAGQRAGQVSDAISAVNNFKPVTSTGLEEAVQTTYCQMNPTAAKCIGTGTQNEFGVISDNIVDFGSGGSGTVYSNSTDDTSGTGSSSNNSGTTTTAKAGTIGSAIVSAGNGQGLEKVAAASVSKGSAPSAAGGGGGGGGGAGSLSGAPVGGGSGQGQSAVAAGKKLQYTGGNGLSVIGGLGLKSGAKKATENGNPFANLLGKDKGADKVLNFGRGPASVGGKGESLFDMISKRYNNVNNDKRLLEYEEQKK